LCLIEAYASPEKYWVVCFGLLAVYLFYEDAIFCHSGLLAALE
jgi:hypothetical protein